MDKWRCACGALNAALAFLCHSCGKPSFDVLRMARERQEDLWDNAQAKRALADAIRTDLDIRDRGGSDMPYTVALWGCADIAAFRRKADAERFLKTFPTTRKKLLPRSKP